MARLPKLARGSLPSCGFRSMVSLDNLFVNSTSFHHLHPMYLPNWISLPLQMTKSFDCHNVVITISSVSGSYVCIEFPDLFPFSLLCTGFQMRGI